MRIIVNDIAASQSGALTVLKSFYEFVKEHDKENEYVFLLSDRYIEETERIKVCICKTVKKNGFEKIRFDFITGKSFIEKLQPDYVLSLQNIITFGLKCRQGVYVHQAIPFQDTKKFSFFKKNERVYAVYQYLIGGIIKKSIKKSDDVFVQTEWMKKSVKNKTGINERKIQVVPFEVSLEYREKTNLVNGMQFFYPTVDENVYKNQQCIYEACKILLDQGIKNFEMTFTIVPDGKKENSNINYCGFLDKEKLFQYYKEKILVFPSYIETVGLPLLEAKSVGGIIFAADCPYAHEILGDYENAYFFAPMSGSDLAELMRKAIENKISLKKSESADIEERKGTWQIVINQVARK